MLAKLYNSSTPHKTEDVLEAAKLGEFQQKYNLYKKFKKLVKSDKGHISCYVVVPPNTAPPLCWSPPPNTDAEYQVFSWLYLTSFTALFSNTAIFQYCHYFRQSRERRY